LSLVVYLGVVAATSVSASLDPNVAPFCLISLAAFYFTVTLPVGTTEAGEVGVRDGVLAGEGLHLVDDHVTAITDHRRTATDQG
jgi:hypothetical protein